MNQKKTNIPHSVQQKLKNIAEKQTQWRPFRKRIRSQELPEQFADLIAALKPFLLPLGQTIASERPFTDHWPAGGPWKSKTKK